MPFFKKHNANQLNRQFNNEFFLFVHMFSVVELNFTLKELIAISKEFDVNHLISLEIWVQFLTAILLKVKQRKMANDLSLKKKPGATRFKDKSLFPLSCMVKKPPLFHRVCNNYNKAMYFHQLIISSLPSLLIFKIYFKAVLQQCKLWKMLYQ